MTIKVKRNNKAGYRYRSNKNILTPNDIREADNFDIQLSKKIKEIESALKRKRVIYDKKKKDPLVAWFIIGKNINKFLKENYLAKEDEDTFWQYLYGRSSLINETKPLTKISQSRNDFKTASILAKYRLNLIEKVGPWALWREILSNKTIIYDKRILEWIIRELIKKPRTRDNARPMLKKVSERFKRIDTLILSDDELSEKLNKI
jgi:hypothetical protein